MYRAASAFARRVPALIEEAIAKRFGFDAPIVIRTAAEIDGIVNGNAFLKAGADPNTLHVGFLWDKPSKSQIAVLDRSPPDEFVVRCGEIYLRLPNGVARSELISQYFDSRLKAITTARNWRTVLSSRRWRRLLDRRALAIPPRVRDVKPQQIVFRARTAQVGHDDPLQSPGGFRRVRLSDGSRHRRPPGSRSGSINAWRAGSKRRDQDHR